MDIKIKIETIRDNMKRVLADVNDELNEIEKFMGYTEEDVKKANNPIGKGSGFRDKMQYVINNWDKIPRNVMGKTLGIKYSTVMSYYYDGQNKYGLKPQ